MKKICSKCKVEKELTEFDRQKNTKDGRRSYCKACKKAYREANREGINRKLKECYYKNREKRLEQQKAYYQVNNGKILEQKKAYYQTEAGKERSRRASHKRRALKKNIAHLGSYTTTEWKECLKFFNYCDAYTGEPLGNDITIDHIIPVSKGGTNNINNLIPCKKAINSSKNASLLNEWYKKQPFYSKSRHNKIKQWIELKSQVNLFEVI